MNAKLMDITFWIEKREAGSSGILKHLNYFLHIVKGLFLACWMNVVALWQRDAIQLV